MTRPVKLVVLAVRKSGCTCAGVDAPHFLGFGSPRGLVKAAHLSSWSTGTLAIVLANQWHNCQIVVSVVVDLNEAMIVRGELICERNRVKCGDGTRSHCFRGSEVRADSTWTDLR